VVKQKLADYICSGGLVCKHDTHHDRHQTEFKS